MSAVNQVIFALSSGAVDTEALYLTPGTYSFVVPAGVTAVSMFCLGGGGGGNDIAPAVSPGGVGGGGGAVVLLDGVDGCGPDAVDDDPQEP